MKNKDSGGQFHVYFGPERTFEMTFKIFCSLSGAVMIVCKSALVCARTNQLVYSLALQVKNLKPAEWLPGYPSSPWGMLASPSRAGPFPLHPHTVRAGSCPSWQCCTSLKQPPSVVEEFKHCYMEFYVVVAFDRILFFKGLVVVVSQLSDILSVSRTP